MSISSSNDSLVIVGDETPNTNEVMEVEHRPPKMKSMHVVSTVRNRYARTIVTSKYANQDTRAHQATFSIVLPDTAFIAGFVMEIKEKKYEAYVKEKEEAKQEYQQAVSSGRAAAHVAVSARDSNKFTVSVNVEPHSDVTFILAYEELLVRKHSKYEMVVNLHLEELLIDLGVDIYINETRPIIHVATPAFRSGNEITNNTTKNEYATIIKDNDAVVHISFYPTIEQQKEMAEVIRNKEKNIDTSEQLSNECKSNGILGQFVIEYDVEREPLGGEVLVNDGYFVHFFAPTELKPIPKHVIFVLDVSGSMGGRKLDQVKEAMKVILNELNPEDYFNLVKFSDDICVLNSAYSWDQIYFFDESKLPESFSVNAKNIKSVQDVIEHITDESCTNIYEALFVGIRLASKGISHVKETDNKCKLQSIVVFLTDGQPNVRECRPNEIIKMVEEKNDSDNKCAIFTLAFGDDANKFFLKELAIKNFGFLRNIYEAADASLQLQDFYKQISSPILTNINFKYSEDIKDVTKQKFDILFDGSEFVVAGKVDEMVDGFVFVEGSTLDGTNKFCPTFITICPKPDEKEKYGSLERLWAYMTIKQLLDEKFKKVEEKTSDNQLDENKTIRGTTEQHALKLALKYSFVTSITSLVVVKPDEPPVLEQLQSLNEESDDLAAAVADYNYRRHLASRAKGCSSLLYDSEEEFEEDDYAPAPTLCWRSMSVEQTMDLAAMTNKSVKKPNKKKRMSDTIRQFFNKLKNENPGEEVWLKRIDIDCNVKNRVATTSERRNYLNFDDKPHETTFTIILPEGALFTEFSMWRAGDADMFKANEHNKKQAKKEYKEAVSNGLGAALVNIQDSNKVNVTAYITPHNEITFELMYTKCLKKKNGKYEVGTNVHCEAHTDTMSVTVLVNEATPIKNVEVLPLRSQNEVMNNVYVDIVKPNDNQFYVEFSTTDKQQEEIAAVLKSTNGDFSGEFIIEYEIEPNPSLVEDSETNAPAPVSFQYFFAVMANN